MRKKTYNFFHLVEVRQKRLPRLLYHERGPHFRRWNQASNSGSLRPTSHATSFFAPRDGPPDASLRVDTLVRRRKPLAGSTYKNTEKYRVHCTTFQLGVASTPISPFGGHRSALAPGFESFAAFRTRGRRWARFAQKEGETGRKLFSD